MSGSTPQVDQGQRRKSSSLAEMVHPQEQVSLRQAFSPAAAIKIAVITGLLVGMNWWQFPRMVGIWRHSPNWSHGFVIPLFSIYLLYVRRDELFSARRSVCILGLPLMILSIVFIVVSFVFIHTHWFCGLGMIALIFSVVLYLAGTRVIRITWLPILFLAFAMPIPEMLYTRIAVPLQELAATASTGVLNVLGVDISVTASALTLTSVNGVSHSLTVAEACSGVRSLMAYLALGVAWAYLEQRPIWQRVVLVLSAGPIAILCNVIRVTITCGMYVVDQPELGRDFMHTFTGILMLGPAVLMFWGLSKLLQSLFVEVEVDEDQEVGGDQACPRGAET
jgi:exosortase